MSCFHDLRLSKVGVSPERSKTARGQSFRPFFSDLGQIGLIQLDSNNRTHITYPIPLSPILLTIPQKTSFTQPTTAMFSRLFPKPGPPPKRFDFANNRFPAHTIWPPHFDDLSPKERFSLEKRFRRRSKLKWARPIWNRNLLLIQWASIVGVIWYGAFYMDWTTVRGKNDAPEFVMAMRRWYFGLGESICGRSESVAIGSGRKEEGE
jgi:hypothetical protein